MTRKLLGAKALAERQDRFISSERECLDFGMRFESHQTLAAFIDALSIYCPLKECPLQ